MKVSKKIKSFGLILVVSLFFVSAALCQNSAENARAQLEVLQAEATVQYNAKQTEQCLTTIDKILRIDANNLKAFELKALLFKQSGDDEKAIQTYAKLIKIGPQKSKPAYHFELGSIRYKQKKYSEAKFHFGISAKHGFNPGTSYFFLGIMAFNAKAWIPAIHDFTKALHYKDADSVKTMTRYYLANAYVQLGRSDAALRSYKEVEDLTYSAVAKKGDEAGTSAVGDLTRSIRKNTLKEIQALNKHQKFINFTMMNQYDTNVQTNPNTVPNSSTQSMEKTFKHTANLILGYSTPPYQMFQWVPTYSVYFNYNYNYLARDYNFITQGITNYFAYKPYLQFTGGIKANGSYTLKNASTSAEYNKIDYKAFSLTGDIGPFFKYEFNPQLFLTAEAGWKPKRFFKDPIGGDSRRSGDGVAAKISGEYYSAYYWFHPQGYVTYEFDNADGKNFIFNAYGGGVSNTIEIMDDMSAIASIDANVLDYNKTSNPKRDDTYIMAHAMLNWAFMEHFTAIADFSYVWNTSTVATSFTYNRILGSLGLSVTF